MNTTTYIALNGGNKEFFEPKPDCKVSVEQREHPIEYPNNLTLAEYHEMTVGSAVSVLSKNSTNPLLSNTKNLVVRQVNLAL
ncbi:hypothetical protein [Nostoc favosum]|uniref:Uncharacterized protein n=1 Tax=Nostoc favosum CHAB5714 TaxID=2780399 RepID=A0ABS8ICL8_9NOSO|nr:hypothetical protein [Nostoc favosum]MCC5601877.1 hypothetical protein [Nostoc favosum CHAB5714]